MRFLLFLLACFFTNSEKNVTTNAAQSTEQCDEQEIFLQIRNTVSVVNGDDHSIGLVIFQREVETVFFCHFISGPADFLKKCVQLSGGGLQLPFQLPTAGDDLVRFLSQLLQDVFINDLVFLEITVLHRQ